MSTHAPLKSFFNTLFPPPRFLSMPAAGLAISDRHVRYVRFKKGSRGRTIDLHGGCALPQGVIESGFINNEKELIKALTNLRKESGISFVHATLPEEKAYLFKTELPHMDEQEIRSSLEFKIQENVPLSPAKAVFDYSLIPDYSPTTIGASVVVLPSKVVSIYTNVLVSAGLTPLSFHTESQAMARAVVPSDDMATSVVVHFRETKTVFFIVSRGVVQFASTIPIGGDALTVLIQKHFKISFDEAEEMKKSHGFATNQENSELFLSFVNELSVVKDEINKLYNYWRNYEPNKELAIKKIILSGSDALLPGIDRYLALDFTAQIEIANVWSNAFSLEKYIPPIDARRALNFPAAIGLALL